MKRGQNHLEQVGNLVSPGNKTDGIAASVSSKSLAHLNQGISWWRSERNLTRPISALLLCVASFPPFIRSPLADAIAREATWDLSFGHQKQFYVQVTWGSASGLDSKMTMRTPMGTVFWTTSRLLEIFVRLMIDDAFLRGEHDLMLYTSQPCQHW